MNVSNTLRFWILFCGALLVFGLNLFWLSPSIMNSGTEDQIWAANLAYVSLRLIVILGFSILAVIWAQLPRFRILSTAAFLTFLEQGMRGVALLQIAKLQPTEWQGMDSSTIFFGLMMGAVTFLPVILIFSWAGYELGSVFRGRKLAKSS